MRTVRWNLTCENVVACSLPPQDKIRVNKCPKLLNHIKTKGGDVRFFSLWEKFHFGRGCLWSFKCSSYVEEQNSGFIVGFAAAASDSNVMPPNFSESELEMKTGKHLKMLISLLLPWFREIYHPNRVILVQDSVRAHGAKKVQTDPKENLSMFVPSEIWLSSSPGLYKVILGCRAWFKNSLMHPLTLLSVLLRQPLDQRSGTSTTKETKRADQSFDLKSPML